MIEFWCVEVNVSSCYVEGRFMREACHVFVYDNYEHANRAATNARKLLGDNAAVLFWGL